MRRKLTAALFTLMLAAAAFSQEPRTSELYKQIAAKDSELFDIGFNKCEIARFEQLIGEEFTFLHDIGGPTRSKAEFIAQIRAGICKPGYKTEREAVADSFEVFPLRRDGRIYAVIQNGRHRFYEFPDGKRTLRSAARFTHVWQLDAAGAWKLVYSLSFDHQAEK